ncbi:MAG: CBS domain-containing protein [Hyphomicrobiaceae bacterium]|nr:CBS domain-containing protein [Hyphomicrobiaceae bacterium]
MHVAAILKVKGRAVETVATGVSLGEVVQRLAVHRIGAVVVTAPGVEVAGIVSERDVVRELAEHGPDVLAWPVDEVMTRGVVTCRESDTIDALMVRMTEGRFRHLPVIENGCLVGIVSIGDVVKHRVAEIEMEASAMRDYIAAG